MIIVFYDGKCGLCSKEINYYRKIAPPGVFNWQDITVSMKDLKKEDVSLTMGLKFLHAKDHNGQMYIGVDAFILIWKQLKRWRVLAILVRLPLLYQMTKILYYFFANWRFKRLQHCQLAQKQESEE